MPGRPDVRHVLLLVVVLLVCLFGTTGCIAVRPWERDLLARPDMAWDDDPRLATLRAHIQFSKEGSLPAGAAGGGGCGCN